MTMCVHGGAVTLARSSRIVFEVFGGTYSRGIRLPHDSQNCDAGRFTVPQSPHTSSSLDGGASAAAAADVSG
jgi:hypothetical protein